MGTSLSPGASAAQALSSRRSEARAEGSLRSLVRDDDCQ
jgi:hypothetical protein